MKTLLIDYLPNYSRVALLDNFEFIEFFIEENKKFNINDIYIGTVKKILPSKFAFIDIGTKRDFFLPLNDKKQKSIFNDGKLTIKQGDFLAVQIEKEGTNIKSSAVTTNLTITGKYAVLLINEPDVLVSRKIDDTIKRDNLKKMGSNLIKYGVIFRTNAQNVDINVIENELLKLSKMADKLINDIKYLSPPALLHKAQTMTEKIIVDTLRDTDEIVLNNSNFGNNLKDVFKNIKVLDNDFELFSNYGIESKIEKLLHNKIWLKSGGFLIIQMVEAMTVIDVNTGKNIKKSFDEMIFKTNMEAVKEVLLQIRLRNISGIILIDFIDMKNNAHKSKVQKFMKDVSKYDRNPIVVYEMNELFIMQITRKKTNKSIYETITKTCSTCDGTGLVRNENYICGEIKNKILSIFKNTIYKYIIVKSNKNIINNLSRIINDNQLFNINDKKISLEIIETAKFDYFEIEKYIYLD